MSYYTKQYYPMKENPALQSNSSSSAAFRQIARKMLNSGITEDMSLHYAFLSNLLGIDRIMTDILSLFLTRGISIRTRGQQAKIIREPEERVTSAWSVLVNKRFIETDKNNDWVITEPLMQSIKEDRPFSESMLLIQQNAFIEEVRGILSPSEMQTFEPEAPIPPSCQKEDGKDRNISISGIEELADDDMSMLNSMETGTLYRVSRLLNEYPDTEFAKRYKSLFSGLGRDENFLLLAMIGWFTIHFTDPFEKRSFSAPVQSLFQKNLGSLMQRGLVVSVYVWQESEKQTKDPYYRIAPRCADLFFGREELIDIASFSQFGVFTPPSNIRAKELFFPKSDQRGITRLRRASQASEYDRIIGRLKQEGLRPCLSALLWGAPGTGKTELVRQIALETGRSVLVTEFQKLQGIYIGESSIHLKDLFQTYRFVCAVSRLAPILLIDEVDGLASQRITGSQSAASKDANAAQSIILEELNSLPGILMATTNLIDNLDEALLRRFMVKVEFHLPDPHTRARLWLSRFPSLSIEEAENLGERYAVSGGLIDNIASMAVTDSILEDRPITATDLVSYCEEQGFGAASRKRIGFF